MFGYGRWGPGKDLDKEMVNFSGWVRNRHWGVYWWLLTGH